MLDRQMRLLLRIGAAIIGLSSLTALATPTALAGALELPLDLDPDVTLWNIRVSGAILLPLAAFMALAAAFFPERALRQSGAIMVCFALLLTVLLAIVNFEDHHFKPDPTQPEELSSFTLMLSVSVIVGEIGDIYY